VGKIKAGIVIGKKTFFDRPAGAVLLGGVAGMGAAPFLWAMLRLLIEVEKPALALVFFAAFGVGILVCLLLVALAAMVIRRIFLDILPRLILYSELISASLLLVFSLFYFFREIPL